MLLDAGIRHLRYSIPWHRIEKRRGHFDWSSVNGPLRFMEANGMQPIADPLHHTSFPDWLTDGFLHPEFPALYERFLDQFSERYEFVTQYTVFNEPLPTTLFCSYTGMWYPHYASDEHFVAMAVQVARAICCGCRLLAAKNRSTQFIHVDTAEHHGALDTRSTEWVEFVNCRRFLLTDLVLGRVNTDHALRRYLVSNGARADDLCWFEDNPGCIDVLGLDYYLHSEMEWKWSEEKGRPDPAPVAHAPLAFAAIAGQYLARYDLPLMLSETNLAGTVEERVIWLKFMEGQCEELAAGGVDFRGFCWYPSIDTTDWSSACTRLTGKLDPQGIWSLEAPHMTRVPTELSQAYGALARGEIRSADIPAHAFGPELQKRVGGYSRWIP